MGEPHAYAHGKDEAKNNARSPLPKSITQRRIPIDIAKIFQIIDEMIGNHHDNGEDAKGVQRKETRGALIIDFFSPYLGPIKRR